MKIKVTKKKIGDWALNILIGLVLASSILSYIIHTNLPS